MCSPGVGSKRPRCPCGRCSWASPPESSASSSSPFLGLPIGFLIGLYVAESLRLKDWRKGLDNAWIAIKALGLGIIIEFSLAMLSTITFAIAVVVHFVTA